MQWNNLRSPPSNANISDNYPRCTLIVPKWDTSNYKKKNTTFAHCKPLSIFNNFKNYKKFSQMYIYPQQYSPRIKLSLVYIL